MSATLFTVEYGIVVKIELDDNLLRGEFINSLKSKKLIRNCQFFHKQSKNIIALSEFNQIVKLLRCRVIGRVGTENQMGIAPCRLPRFIERLKLDTQRFGDLNEFALKNVLIVLGQEITVVVRDHVITHQVRGGS